MPRPPRVRGFPALVLLVCCCALAGFALRASGQAWAEGATIDTRRPAIAIDDLERRLRHLASDALAGRETAREGARVAGDYVAAEMQRAGLEPAGTDGWFQSFPVRRPRLGRDNGLELAHDGEILTFDVERDWNPFSVSPTSEAQGPLLFAGYGITAPGRAWKDGAGLEHEGWDDFAGMDVQGKVVLVLRKDPGWNDVRHAAFLAKLSNAARHGAAALLLVNDMASARDGDVIHHWSAPIGAAAGSGKIPYAFVTRAVAAELLGADVEALAQREERLRAEGPASTSIEGAEVRIRTALMTRETVEARNVLGMVPGKDPALAGEVVVVGAHYDHIGRGFFGSLGGAAGAGQIHPGADDNASGTSALLEIAEYFGAPEHRTRRPILFIAFSGEEMGLLGSRHYVANPTLPLRDIVCMVNLDMVGRSREGRIHVGGVGTGKGLKDVVALANEAAELHIAWNPGGAAPSDSMVFFRKKVPVLFFFTGIHADYHRPSDTADKIEFASLRDITEVVSGTVRSLADAGERLVYTEPPRPPRPPLIGIQLERMPATQGIGVAAVTAGGPAERAGVRAGDVLVGLAGQPIRTAQDLMGVIRHLKAGRAIQIEVARGDERLSLELVPVKRGARR